MAKFKIGDIVLYKNGDNVFKLGLIQKVYEKKRLMKNLFNETVPFLGTVSYLVWFFTDDLCKISEKSLYPIENISIVREFILKNNQDNS